MAQFMISVTAVMPFVLYLAFGYTVRRLGVTTVEFLRKLNALSFAVFYPCMAFDNMYSMDTSEPMSPFFFLFAFVMLCLCMLLGLIIIPKLEPDRPKIPVIVQGVFRSNILLFAIPLTQNLFGSGPVALATAIVVLIVPFYNAGGVILFESFCSKQKSSPAQLLKRVITNPLISGCLLGLVFKFAGIRLPEVLLKVIKQYSALTTPLALFILGGTLQFASVKKNRTRIVGTLLVKLFLIPGISLFLARMCGFSAVEQFVLWILFAAPVATALFPMAQAMGGDAELAGELVAISTTAFVFTSVIWLTFMQMIGVF